ncbi:MAG: hypothetical protein GEU91_24020 [Rhizobiales bacterium]|nr:hypothetical protein [Hyphomicrobiales bacterium]
MRVASLVHRLRQHARRLWNAEEGNVAIIFTIALIPIVGLTGAAIDYSRASSVRTAMQAALDATALAMSKDATSLTASALNEKAAAYFAAAFNRPEVIQISAVYSTEGGSSVTVTGTGSVDTLLMGIMGVNSIPIGSFSKTAWGSTRLRVALVLDTTGSMASAGKMNALKTATKDLLTQLQSAASNNGDVYVSIIPFSKNVNLDSSSHNSNWIDWSDWEDEPPYIKNNKPSNWEQIGPGSNCPFAKLLFLSSHGFVCMDRPATASGSSTTSTIPSSGTDAGYICPSVDDGSKVSSKRAVYYNGCYNSVQETKTIATGSSASCGTLSNCSCTGSGSSKTCKQTYYNHTWIKNARSTWNGCVIDRGTSTAPGTNPGNDQKVTAPTTSDATTLFPAEQYRSCSPAVMGLNYNWSAMKSMVDNLYPEGATNQPIGLVWGWQSLIGGGPLTAPAKDPSYDYTEVIVLMSDGLNTLDRWYGNGSDTSTSVDRRMYDSTAGGIGTCANIKDAKITIYTVHVNTEGGPMSTLLKDCASTDKFTSEKLFWMVTTASGLGTVFNKIGTDLTKLRIAR